MYNIKPCVAVVLMCLLSVVYTSAYSQTTSNNSFTTLEGTYSDKINIQCITPYVNKDCTVKITVVLDKEMLEVQTKDYGKFYWCDTWSSTPCYVTGSYTVVEQIPLRLLADQEVQIKTTKVNGYCFNMFGSNSTCIVQ